MLLLTGWTQDWWYTDEARERGTAVHEWTGWYDLGGVDVPSFTSAYRGYLLAHVAAMQTLAPEILAVEEPGMHPAWRYGCRPDRVWRYQGGLMVPDLKTGDPEPGHAVQTALQAMMLEHRYKLPARMWRRACLYLKENGKWRLKEHEDPVDFLHAEKACRDTCR